MNLLSRFLPMLALVVPLLGGCSASPPVQYHALAPARSPLPAGSAALLVEVMPVSIPERQNREEMVLTGAGHDVRVLDDDRWAAPLADEIRQMLDDSLWQRLQAADIYRVPMSATPDGVPHYRLALRIERFAADPGRQAAVDASWTVRKLPQGAPAVCRAGFVVPLPDTSPDGAAAALAEGTGRLAEAVAASIGGLEAGASAVCPAPPAVGDGR